MRGTHHRLRLYYLLGKLLRGFFILLYGLLIICLLLVIAIGLEAAWVVLTALGPWILKLGVTLGCSLVILVLFETWQ